MSQVRRSWPIAAGALLAVLALAALYWLLPIRGQVTVTPSSQQ